MSSHGAWPRPNSAARLRVLTCVRYPPCLCRPGSGKTATLLGARELRNDATGLPIYQLEFVVRSEKPAWERHNLSVLYGDAGGRLFTYTAHVQTPALRKNLPFDAIRDFAPISHIALSANIVAVLPGFPANTLDELITMVRASPGKYAYGTFGNATSAHIAGELLKRDARLDMAHVPYKGAAPLLVDLLAGHVPIGFVDSGSSMPHLKAGRLKALVINGTRRSSLLPAVPTFLEAGYKGFEPYGWIGALFPAGVPAERVTLMSSEMARIVKTPQMQQKLRDLNLEPLGSNASDFATVLANDLVSWSRLVTELGIHED